MKSESSALGAVIIGVVFASSCAVVPEYNTAFVDYTEDEVATGMTSERHEIVDYCGHIQTVSKRNSTVTVVAALLSGSVLTVAPVVAGVLLPEVELGGEKRNLAPIYTVVGTAGAALTSFFIYRTTEDAKAGERVTLAFKENSAKIADPAEPLIELRASCDDVVAQWVGGRAGGLDGFKKKEDSAGNPAAKPGKPAAAADGKAAAPAADGKAAAPAADGKAAAPAADGKAAAPAAPPPAADGKTAAPAADG